jgi:hypothetical protein
MDSSHLFSLKPKQDRPERAVCRLTPILLFLLCWIVSLFSLCRPANVASTRVALELLCWAPGPSWLNASLHSASADLAWGVPEQWLLSANVLPPETVQSSHTKAVCAGWERNRVLIDPIIPSLSVFCSRTAAHIYTQLVSLLFQSFGCYSADVFALGFPMRCSSQFPPKYFCACKSKSKSKILGPHWFSG